MLNKQLCKRCYITYADSPDAWDAYVFMGINSNSDNTPPEQRFDKYWQDFFCPCLHSFDGRSIFDKPPSKCPYLLEYTVSETSLIKQYLTSYLFMWHKDKLFALIMTLVVIFGLCIGIMGLWSLLC